MTMKIGMEVVVDAKDRIFFVEFRCRNCNHAFAKAFKKGTVIEEDYFPPHTTCLYKMDGVEKDVAVMCPQCETDFVAKRF